MKHIIIVEKDGVKETWGGITNACRAHPEFKYHSIKAKSFPFEYKGYTFSKVEYNSKKIS